MPFCRLINNKINKMLINFNNTRVIMLTIDLYFTLDKQ